LLLKNKKNQFFLPFICCRLGRSRIVREKKEKARERERKVRKKHKKKSKKKNKKMREYPYKLTKSNL
jgi:hypothetical protein